MTSRIVKWIPEKGYGFIQRLDTSRRDWFCHCRDVIDYDETLMTIGRVVTFDTAEDLGPNKERAVNVQVVQ